MWKIEIWYNLALISGLATYASFVWAVFMPGLASFSMAFFVAGPIFIISAVMFMWLDTIAKDNDGRVD